MQQKRKPSILKSLLGTKQRAPQKKDLRKSPTPLDDAQMRQVAGGDGSNTSPKGTW